MASGLYDFKNVGRGETNHERHGRCSTARVREGHMFAARLTYETRLAPLMREDEDLLDLYLLVAPEDNELTALSVWKSPDAFSRVSNTEDYKDAVDALAVHFEIDTVVSDDILAYRITDEDE